ncbi:MAG: diacylglycerol kinase family protein [Ferruginibacter sp.]|nr:diacylglycerol kinase family protein [Ferruginibacter sp.]
MKEKFLKSLKYAFNGISYTFKNELNFKIQVLFAIVVVILGLLLSITKTEWIIILLCIAFVLCAELFNTAIETICNKIEPNIHPQIKIIKDVSAAAVLVVAIAAAIVGAIIFVPKIF